MKIPAFVLLILISEKTLCFQLEPEKDEAVFQGKCSSRLCSQLCYELHDGMFECDCTHGYELNQDGYSCKPNNISYNLSINESKFGDDYGSSDVFYQKGVSFSAKLADSNRDDANEITKIDVDNQSKTSTLNVKQDFKNILRNNSFNPTSSLPISVNIPRFYQTSWLAFRPFKGANLVTEINIEFRPEQLNGILLLSGEREDLRGDFMIVSLSNGLIEFLFDCGSGKGVIISSETVILHQWNTLIIYRYRWDAWIELNEKRRVRGRSSGIFSRITFRSPVFLGGKGNLTSETLHKKKIHTSKGFSGCIRKFIVNGHQYELSKLSSNEIISKSNLNECAIDQCSFVTCLHGGRCQSSSSSCLCPLGFGGKFCENKLDLKIPMFNGTSNLRYSALGESAIIWLEIKLVIKPQSADGLILFSGKNDLGDFIALYLNFGFVEFIYDLGSGITSVRSKFPLSIDQWHTIKISRTARLAVMKVDTQPEIMAVSPNGFWHLSLPFSLYLGGVLKLNLLPSNLRDRGFFVGCVGQFEINNRNVELVEDALGGVNIANCNDSCNQNCMPDYSFENNSSKLVENLNVESAVENTNEISNEISNENNAIAKTNPKKYAFDVVDDSSDHFDGSLHIIEKEDNRNASYDDAVHKRIVRVSLQKPIKRNQEACFKGNDSFVLYDIHKFTKTGEKYQNNVNIRFKTFAPNGLMFLIYQKYANKFEHVFALSVEDGFMHLIYNHASTYIEITYNGTKVNDGLWHRVRALRKNQKGSLRIDGGRPVSIRRRAKQKFFNATPGLYLGGSSNSSLNGFNGCISDVILNTEDGEHRLDLNILRPDETLNVNLNETL